MTLIMDMDIIISPCSLTWREMVLKGSVCSPCSWNQSKREYCLCHQHLLTRGDVYPFNSLLMELNLCCVSTRLTSGEEIWSRYFSQLPFTHDDHRVQLFRALLQDFFSLDIGRKTLSLSRPFRQTQTLWIDYHQLEQAKVPHLSDALSLAPTDALSCLGAAGHQAMVTYHMDAPQERVLVRLFNYHPAELAIQSLKASWIGKLATVTGCVVRCNPAKPLFASLMYVCSKCDWRETRNYSDGCCLPPTKCARPNCKNRQVQADMQSAVMVDWQKIRLQEILPIEKQISGYVARTVDVELQNDLVNCCSSGDTVTVTGIVKVLSSELGKKSNDAGKGRELFVLYLDAISVQKSTEEDNDDIRRDPRKLGTTPTSFTKKELEFIADFYQHCLGDQLQHLVHSFCPEICGHDLIKAGILLALVGGVEKHIEDNDQVPVRGDIHLLIVGDPGMGKSELLKAAAAAAPRGVYVSGTTSSGSGLTASVIKDSITGDFTFEGLYFSNLSFEMKASLYSAGAMVLAHGGVCCIDEFDKMTQQHQALLEAMEQQVISIAKAGLVASLPSKTTVIAAANPAEGHYQKSKTLKQNLNIEVPMLSRFDVVYLLMDKPDSRLDLILSEHILSSKTQRTVPTKQHRGSKGPKTAPERRSLMESLRLGSCGSFQQIPVHLMKTYLAYARQYVKPRLSDEAVAALKEFYLKLRGASCVTDELPVTARQLESLIRLSEARAKIELREIVTHQDAEDAISLLKEALYDKFVDKEGAFKDIRSENGQRKKKNQMDQFLTALRNYALRQGTDLVSMSDIYSVADEMELQVQSIQDLVEKLNNQGDLLKKGVQLYRIAKCQDHHHQDSPHQQRVTGIGFSSLQQ